MPEQIYPQIWMLNPKEIRDHLAIVFGVEQSSATEVRDETVISDGRNEIDLKAITLEKMCEYIGSQEEFHRAWTITLAKAKHELHPPVGEIKPPSRAEAMGIVEPESPSYAYTKDGVDVTDKVLYGSGTMTTNGDIILDDPTLTTNPGTNESTTQESK